MRSQRKWLHASPAFIVISILLLAPITFCDLKVSQLVADRANWVGRFVSDFGELPGYALIYFALVYLIVVSSSLRERFVCGGLLLLGVLFVFTELTSFVNAVVSGCVLMLVAVLLLFVASQLKTQRAVPRVARLTVLMAAIAPLFIVQTMKWLWGRVRFRNLSPDHSDFSPWFLPQGPTGIIRFRLVIPRWGGCSSH